MQVQWVMEISTDQATIKPNNRLDTVVLLHLQCIMFTNLL